jgi:hypothetical protein
MGTRIRVQRVGIVHADMRRSIRTYGAKTVTEKTVIDVRPYRDAMRLSDPITAELSGMRRCGSNKLRSWRQCRHRSVPAAHRQAATSRIDVIHPDALRRL